MGDLGPTVDTRSITRFTAVNHPSNREAAVARVVFFRPYQQYATRTDRRDIAPGTGAGRKKEQETYETVEPGKPMKKPGSSLGQISADGK